MEQRKNCIRIHRLQDIEFQFVESKVMKCLEMILLRLDVVFIHQNIYDRQPGKAQSDIS